MKLLFFMKNPVIQPASALFLSQAIRPARRRRPREPGERTARCRPWTRRPLPSRLFAMPAALPAVRSGPPADIAGSMVSTFCSASGRLMFVRVIESINQGIFVLRAYRRLSARENLLKRLLQVLIRLSSAGPVLLPPRPSSCLASSIILSTVIPRCDSCCWMLFSGLGSRPPQPRFRPPTSPFPTMLAAPSDQRSHRRGHQKK